MEYRALTQATLCYTSVIFPLMDRQYVLLGYKPKLWAKAENFVRVE